MHCPEALAWSIKKPYRRRVAGHKFRDSIIDVWHIDPNDKDQSPVCGSKWWRWHISHYKIAFMPWVIFKRKYITTCGWCGEKSSKEKGLTNFKDFNGNVSYHRECMAKRSAAHHAHDPKTCWQCTHPAS